jgi:hypothetical protein
VVVVGAGPTGLMLAGELALAGVAVEVIERQGAPSGQSRGGGVNPRTAEVLAMRGLLDAAASRAIPRESTGGHFAGLPAPLDARPWRTRYPQGLLIPQDRLEDVLEAHLVGLGVTVRRRTELTGIEADEAGVTADVAGPGGTYTLRGLYLVACDGGHSTIRTPTGVGFPGRAGTPDLTLDTGDGLTRVSALLRSGHGLLLELGAAAAPDSLPPRVDRVVARVVDSEIGTALGATADVDRVLVRPDGHVCWVGSGPHASPTVALPRWFCFSRSRENVGVPTEDD